jgi:cytochrome c biogenesis protein CcmG, thiol:disulfide interchange protein DsbE
VPIVGINYKDDPAAARQWLARYGNPYEFNIVDQDGRLGVELGVYGAPETFLVDASGTIVYKRVGEVNRHVWENEIQPRIEALGGVMTEPRHG